MVWTLPVERIGLMKVSEHCFSLEVPDPCCVDGKTDRINGRLVIHHRMMVAYPEDVFGVYAMLGPCVWYPSPIPFVCGIEYHRVGHFTHFHKTEHRPGMSGLVPFDHSGPVGQPIMVGKKFYLIAITLRHHG